MSYSDETLEYLSQFPPLLLQCSEGRRVLTRLHPRLFAILYLDKHLKDADGHVSFSEVHLDWFEQMRTWVVPCDRPRQWRRAYVAPRSCGKSSVWFLFAPLWAGAHGHAKFIAAFADSTGQSELHLATFKLELQRNALLKRDFPEFCRLARSPNGHTEADNRMMLKTKSGFVFTARGIDASSLGMKVGEMRPDVLIFDDVEPAESNYSAYQAGKRLATITDALLPLNELARVVIVGTVTMPESIIHSLVKTVTSIDTPAQWITDEKFTCHYYPAILVNEDGSERSIWPEKWAIEFLESIRHTRSYALNYANDPIGADGGYWSMGDFIHVPLDSCTRWIISVDPAVTTSERSDYTGVAVVGWSPTANRCMVAFAAQVKLTGPLLREYLVRLCERFPQVRVILIETNQGGNLWGDVLHHMPVKVLTITQHVKKEVRAANALGFYQRGRVSHAEGLDALEQQMCSFPNVLHDDVTDAVVTAVLRFMAPAKKKHLGVSTGVYA